MFRITNESAWKFATSVGGSVSFAFVGAGTGDIMLTPPGGGLVTYHYVSAGAGLSAGVKLNASSSTTDSFSIGKIYLLDTFTGMELTPLDIEGACMTVELSVGAGLGASGSAMLLGIPPAKLQEEVVTDAIAIAMLQGAGAGGAIALSYGLLKDYAKALLVMGGFNSGPQLTAGALGSIGYLWMDRPPRASTAPMPSWSDEEATSTRSSTAAREVALILPCDVLFDFDKSNIKPRAEPNLKKVGAIVKSHWGSTVIVVGHTDSVGTDAYNIGLSVQRARSVAQWLAKNGYANSARLMWFGLGKTKPLASNHDEKGRARNRRVEIKIITGG